MMKRLIALLLTLCLAAVSCAALAEEAAGPALEKNLVILYTSDVHCGRLTYFSPVQFSNTLDPRDGRIVNLTLSRDMQL